MDLKQRLRLQCRGRPEQCVKVDRHGQAQFCHRVTALYVFFGAPGVEQVHVSERQGVDGQVPAECRAGEQVRPALHEDLRIPKG